MQLNQLMLWHSSATIGSFYRRRLFARPARPRNPAAAREK
jgi:hypothetical protein